MTTADTLSQLRQRITAGYSVLSLRTFEEQRWEGELRSIAEELERGFAVWTLTSGLIPALVDGSDSHSPLALLTQLAECPSDQLVLLKDLHRHLSDPAVSRKLRDILPSLPARRVTLLMMSPVDDIPPELLKDITRVELPLPGMDEMRQVLHTVSAELSRTPDWLPAQQEKLVQGVLGLTADEGRRALTSVLAGCEEWTDDIFRLLAAEKRHLIQGANLLEFFDLDASLDDVGGLDGLKEWIEQRAAAFHPDAAQRGVSLPRGVLLAGVQGCGKSLSARAIARMLGFPLVRLDVGSLLESAVGGSEQNLRDVLRLMDTIAPAVLWLEELDKAFAGFTDEGGGDAVLSRLVGRFLTWLQEHTSRVFVVATANKIRQLPPEFLRRGRFDDIFFVDLPNFDERLDIFRIHLSRRGWKEDKFDLGELASTTDGFSGAEIEQVVNSALIESFAQNRVPTQQDLIESRERTVPLSVTMEDEIFELREWARTRCRPATLDHRIMQVMEAEERQGEAPAQQPLARPKWMDLAEHGQLAPAIVEYIRARDHALWSNLLKDLQPYFTVRGDYGVVLRSQPKVALWLRISRELADCLCEAIEGRRLYLHVLDAKSYAAAESPQLPPLTALPSEPQKTAAWLPTAFKLLPPPTGSGPLGKVARVKMSG